MLIIRDFGLLFLKSCRIKSLVAGCGFLGVYQKNLTSNFVSLFMFAVFSNALIDTDCLQSVANQCNNIRAVA